jgi:tryptophan synthase alpha chain
MTYYNILFTYGIGPFAAAMERGSLQGAIIADLPPEEGGEYLRAMEKHGIAPVFIFSPKTPYGRMQYIASHTRGFVYCAARKGVTGTETNFSKDLEDYLQQCRRATSLPLAVGFGVQAKEDVEFLKGRADMAVVGTQTLRVLEEKGMDAVGDFIKGLRD